MTTQPSTEPILPPFCTLASDRLPQAPPPGTAESHALAAWEVLTGARVARSAGSGRMSRLAGYLRQGDELTRDRILWIVLHAFDGAEERWACRRARSPAMPDAEVRMAIIQEMGGPAGDPDEMTTLGFWQRDTGFYFDCRGPRVDITGPGRGSHRIGPAGLVAAARRLLGLPHGPGHSVAHTPARAQSLPIGEAEIRGHEPLQLCLL
jgi:hypothetical protein